MLASGCGYMETDQGVAMDTDPSRKWSRKRLQHRPISEEQLSSMFITLGDFKVSVMKNTLAFDWKLVILVGVC